MPFEQYVENTLPNEWISSWDGESIKSGAVAVKSYAWYWVNHYGGYFNTPGTCFDVTDDTSFQVYLPNTAQVRTNNAVQQTWNVVARDGSHAVRQASYLAYLTSAGSGESCGAGHNGSQLSQWGSQACAAAGLTYAQILHTYYDPGLELATIRSGPVSAPPSGPVVLASSGVLVAYRTSAGNVLGASQPAPGSAFGRWSVINQGPQFAGQPAALLAANRTLVVYALGSGGHLLGDGQPRPGAAFTGWRVMGVGSPTLRSDPTPLLAANGALVIYATASDGNVWGIGQSRPGSAFSAWIRLSDTGGFTGRPAALVTAAHQIVVYARHGATIAGAGQAVAGGRFSAFADLGSGSPSVTGDPSAMQAADGTLAVYSVAAAASAG
ncbi:MAG: SpoIID/LytB domain-containing protein, partial [Actinomycetota bacterium]|nr:SpoIID/LytB domain-containing protein [Actinomycetota bacterium]